MASDFAPLTEWFNNLNRAFSPEANRRILAKAGAAGKKAALDAASDSLGSDRKFGHWKGKPALSAGYDSEGTSQIVVNFRPVGLWRLAEAGRHSSGPIFPKRGRGKGRGVVAGRALLTPNGPRASSSFGRSRGLKTYSDASKKAQTTVPKAAHDQFVEEVGKALH